MSTENSTLVKVGNIIAKKHDLKVLNACIKASRPALLVGETGTGKTSLLREIAKIKKKKLVRVSVNGSMGIKNKIKLASIGINTESVYDYYPKKNTRVVDSDDIYTPIAEILSDLIKRG